MLSGVETHVRAFDVFPASAVHILSGFDTFKVTEDSSPDVAGRALEVPQGSTEKVLVGEKATAVCDRQFAIRPLAHRFAQSQASLRQRKSNRCDHVEQSPN